MKKGLFISLIFILSFVLVALNISSAEITQKYGPLNLSILDFVLVESNQVVDTLTRTFKLKVENTGKEPLYDVKVTLIHASNQATIDEGEVYLGSVNPGETVISNDDFTYTVDVSKTRVIPEIDLHWKVEYQDINGEHQGEALVSEIF